VDDMLAPSAAQVRANAKHHVRLTAACRLYRLKTILKRLRLRRAISINSWLRLIAAINADL
jgi:hypothetical protein